MLMVLKIIISLLISYLVGSIPTAYLLGRLFKGIDIRKYGSGNVGATNAFRVLGRPAGIIVLIIDILKGAIVTVFIAGLFGLEKDAFKIMTGIAAVSGHNWSAFLNFKGGKGVATTVGVLLGLAIKISGLRLIFALVVLCWTTVFLISGFVSLASIIASIILPIFILVFNQSLQLIILGIIFCLFIVWRHKSNINRLISGNESQASFCLFKRKRFPK